MSRWFGESWDAPVCDPDLHVPTPVGEVCLYCEQPILPDDQGMEVAHLGDPPAVYYHRLCMMLNVIPCGMWTPEMHDHAEKIGYEHSHACNLPKEMRRDSRNG